MQTDSTSLIERIRRRDGDALAQYLELHRPRLLAHIQRRLGPALRRKVEAEDIVQETGAQAVQSLPSVELGDRDPFGWLCFLAERRIIDAHRRYCTAQKREAGREIPLDERGDHSGQPGIIDLLVASMTTPSQAFSRDRRLERLRQAVDSLPDDQREALRLRYLEGLPSKDVADRLGKTDGAVRVMLTRTLRRLQEVLGPEAAP